MSPKITTENGQTGVQPYKAAIFDQYITWRALGGMIVEEDNPATPNHVRIMPLQEFCDTFGIERRTTWRWKTNTPDLAERIEKRRNEIVPLARVSAVWNQNFLMAMQTKDKRAAVDAQKIFLGHFGNLQLPVQREVVKHEGESWATLVAQKKAEADKTIIEARVVDATTDNQS